MTASLGQVRATAGRRISAACNISAAAAAIETRVLARQALGCDDRELIIRSGDKLAADELARFCSLVARRLRKTPIAHITGRREFYGLMLQCSPAALIPRPESELIVDLALRLLAPNAAGRLADLGCGSGALAGAIAAERGNLEIDAYEKDRQAAQLAGRNLRALARRARLKIGSWENIEQNAYRMIVANPPYLTSAETDAAIAAGDLHDPRASLDGGADGLEGLRSATGAAWRGLQDGGTLIIEHGSSQQQAVCELLKQAGFGQIGAHHDLAGWPRAVTGRRPAAS